VRGLPEPDRRRANARRCMERQGDQQALTPPPTSRDPDGAQDGAPDSSASAGAPGGLDGRHAARAAAVHVVDQHEAVVHHHPRERHHADQREEVEVPAGEEVPPDGADHPERDCRHDDDGLQVGAERDGEQREDHEERDHEAPAQVLEELALLALLALERVRHAGMPGEDVRQRHRAQVHHHVVRRHPRGIAVGVAGDRRAAGTRPGGAGGPAADCDRLPSRRRHPRRLPARRRGALPTCQGAARPRAATRRSLSRPHGPRLHHRASATAAGCGPAALPAGGGRCRARARRARTRPDRAGRRGRSRAPRDRARRRRIATRACGTSRRSSARS
jgi:hypothetical protein